tara:strand:- start:3257 stop:3604 length:348 start_codon:yes stop_codon:yes gene_type:complete
MKRRSKQQVAREKVWSRVIRNKHDNKWPIIFSELSSMYNEATVIKLASIVWWDCQTDKEEYDWSYVYSIMKKYYSHIEYEYEECDLVNGLIYVGYPQDLALFRVKKPKNKNGRKK